MMMLHVLKDKDWTVTSWKIHFIQHEITRRDGELLNADYWSSGSFQPQILFYSASQAGLLEFAWIAGTVCKIPHFLSRLVGGPNERLRRRLLPLWLLLHLLSGVRRPGWPPGSEEEVYRGSADGKSQTRHSNTRPSPRDYVARLTVYDSSLVWRQCQQQDDMTLFKLAERATITKCIF